jgi:hypothetical protein
MEVGEPSSLIFGHSPAFAVIVLIYSHPHSPRVVICAVFGEAP